MGFGEELIKLRLGEDGEGLVAVVAEHRKMEVGLVVVACGEGFVECVMAAGSAGSVRWRWWSSDKICEWGGRERMCYSYRVAHMDSVFGWVSLTHSH